MPVRATKLAQRAVVITSCIFYTFLFVIWVTSSAQPSLVSNQISDQSSGQSFGFQERAPRSIEESKLDGQKTSNWLIADNDNPLLSSEVKRSKHKNIDTSLSDIFISVKTTKKFHSTRLDIILKTWFNLAKEQIYFFTDADDKHYNDRSGGHLINTNCSSSHNRKALCCKMSVEFDTFIESKKKWFCHFDDDNYVNVPQLLALVRQYDPKQDWYLGKPSIRQPLEIVNRANKASKISFWFATGGAGFCLSRALALKMIPIASGGKFISIGEKIRLPDDVTLGYIVEHLLSKRLTVIDTLHSHLEPMKFIKDSALSKQISFSYSRYGNQFNRLSIERGFDVNKDETRFLSLHCHLFPELNSCHKQTNIR